MSRSAFYVSSLLIISINAESWSCGKFCGPCQVPNELCNLQCLGYESCKEGTLTCAASNGRTDLCTIDCRHDKACLAATVQATTVYTELSVNCLMPGSCEELQVYAAHGADVFINCDAANSCSNLYLAAFDARDVFINCVGEASCEGARIECGTGSCLMNCLNNMGGVCNGIYLGCGQSPRCQINCRGNQKCDTMTINTVGAIGFQCIGDPATECVGAPAPFMLPTKPPTNFPTKSPSPAPTFSPTSIPSIPPTSSPTPRPTGNPSHFPSNAPTFSPTSYPTESPTFRPSTDPSKSPTLSPSVSPTLPPTSNPTMIPTFNPTVQPVTNSPSSFPTINPLPPTAFPTSPPINQFNIMYNTAVDDRNNAVDQNTDGLLQGLATNQTEGYLILTCILIAFCICCCLPLFCLIYRKVHKTNHTVLRFRKSKNDEDDDEDIDDVEDDDMASPGPPIKPFRDEEEGDNFVPKPGKLTRLESKSMTATRDGYSSQYGFASNCVTMPFTATNSRTRQTRHNAIKHGQQSVEELEYGDNNGVCSNYMEEAEVTQNIVKVSIWFIENVKLPQYCELFVLNGFTSIDSIQSIKEMYQLEMLGIKRADHRYQIMREINLLHGDQSDSDDLLQDGKIQTGAPNKPPPPAPSSTSYSKKARRNKSSRHRAATRDGVEMVSPEETLGIPPEFADRVKVVKAKNGDQIWHIKDVMEQDLINDDRKSRKGKMRVDDDVGSEDSDRDNSSFGQQNPSISDSSLLRAFKNNLIE